MLESPTAKDEDGLSEHRGGGGRDGYQRPRGPQISTGEGAGEVLLPQRKLIDKSGTTGCVNPGRDSRNLGTIFLDHVCTLDIGHVV